MSERRRSKYAGRERKRGLDKRDATDPRSLVAMVKDYLEWLAVQNYSKETRYTRDRQLNSFITWCDQRGLSHASEITRPILQRYQRWMYLYRKPGGDTLSFQVQRERLVALRVFFKWLAKNNHILFNPASEARATAPADPTTASDPHGGRSGADRHVARHERPAGNARPGDPRDGLFDRNEANELINVKPYDVDLERGTVFVREGKGKKDRVIPIGERAGHWVKRYLAEVRPRLVVEPDESWLFVTSYGEGFTRMGMSNLVRGYVRKSGVQKPGSCHLFRHTMATLMLENGADIRFIQQMLGHAKLTTTEIYTQVSIRKLQEVHHLTHPSARLEEGPEPNVAALAEEPEATREALLDTLAVEAVEDEEEEEEDLDDGQDVDE